jgi:hypothetical protein
LISHPRLVLQARDLVLDLLQRSRRAILKIADPVCLRYDSGRYAAEPATAYPTTFFLVPRIRSE